MKGFDDVSRAATCASGVILESRSPESVVAKRRDSVQKPYGMTSAGGGRTANTSILSFQGPHTSGNLESRNKKGKGLYKRTVSQVHAWDDNYNNSSRNSAGRTLAGRQTLRDDDKKCIVSCCRFGGLRHYKNSVAPLIKRARTICRLQGRGFTLIELLVVVLIIGILAAMALPDYQRATEISRVGAALSFSRAFRDSVDRYYMQNGRFPSSPDALDIGLTQCPKYFSCAYHELTTQGKFQIDRKNGPFSYGIITRSAVSPALPNTIYCYALRSNKKGVEFCEHWGEDATPKDGTWFRTLIQ